MSDNYELTIDINRLKDSSEKVKSIDRYISNYNLKKHFTSISNLLEEVDKKYKCTFDFEQEELNTMIRDIDEIQHDIGLLNNTLDLALNNNIDVIGKGNYPENVTPSFRKKITDNLKNEVITIPTYPPEQQQTQEKQPLIPEGYNTVPIGLGIAATGISASVGFVVASEMQPTPKKKKSTYKEQEEGLVIDDYFDDSNPLIETQNDFDESYEPKKVMANEETDYGCQSARNKESKEKFMSMIDED